MTRWTVLVAAGAVLVLGAPTLAWASFFDVYGELPAPSYQEREEEVIAFPTGTGVANAKFENLTGRQTIPPEGMTVQSFFDIYCDIRPYDGQPWGSATAQGHAWLTFTPPGVGDAFEAEVVSLDAYGGSLPAGVMIRESPTRQSLGGGTCQALGGGGGGGGGGYMVDSFFDIYVELTVDGGNTWMPADQPMHVQGTPEPATLSLLALGGLVALRRRRA